MFEQETPKTILFVDDEEAILEIAAEHFQNLGYRVLTAVNGKAATDIIESGEHAVDCCFTDINMPEMDGLELAEYLRNYDNTLPVIIMTGYPSLDNTLRTLKNGVVDFLIKPVNLEQMTLSLQRVLRERELFIKNILLNKELESQKKIEALNRELVHKVDELRVLNRIMSELMSLNTGSEVMRRIVEMTTTITPADSAVFYAVSGAVEAPFALTRADRSKPRGQDDAVHGVEGAASAFDMGEVPPPPVFRDLVRKISRDEMPLIIADTSAHPLTHEARSFIGVPLKIRDTVFGVLVAVKTENTVRFNEKDLYYLSFMVRQAAYLVENLALYENIYENLFSTLSALVKAVEARDVYTKEHSSRVRDMAVMIAEAYGCTRDEIDVLDFAARLHDIGKIGIRDDILLKNGRLTDAEYQKIKEHPLIGESIIGQLGLWEREKQIVRHHHEWMDGSGYPDGLKGEDIPLLSRILSVADAYDAMMSTRAYRKEMPEPEVLRIIRSAGGIQFDPRIVDIFLGLQTKNRINAAHHQVH